jgi:hypothetical protein
MYKSYNSDQEGGAYLPALANVDLGEGASELKELDSELGQAVVL